MTWREEGMTDNWKWRNKREPTHIDCDTNVAAKLSGLAFIGAFPGTFVTVNASRVITFASGYS
ncbi:hypothetical protein P5673_013537 [Acropora cervicornis]|uniref:Uncharacterized protein n=1 Tax=Acropora cervicornis TaxID=6130 RepID=A0AAD9QLJ5_ACRCE|nr:hypothetical protein P5673_013537 [Acropora cervicornis]